MRTLSHTIKQIERCRFHSNYISSVRKVRYSKLYADYKLKVKSYPERNLGWLRDHDPCQEWRRRLPRDWRVHVENPPSIPSLCSRAGTLALAGWLCDRATVLCALWTGKKLGYFCGNILVRFFSFIE